VFVNVCEEDLPSLSPPKRIVFASERWKRKYDSRFLQREAGRIQALLPIARDDKDIKFLKKVNYRDADNASVVFADIVSYKSIDEDISVFVLETHRQVDIVSKVVENCAFVKGSRLPTSKKMACHFETYLKYVHLFPPGATVFYFGLFVFDTCILEEVKNLSLSKSQKKVVITFSMDGRMEETGVEKDDVPCLYELSDNKFKSMKPLSRSELVDSHLGNF
tara:strand:+ start:446 stop:1105 length:660 start_codon:yes stop_codon:yes gene_type:complete